VVRVGRATHRVNGHGLLSGAARGGEVVRHAVGRRSATPVPPYGHAPRLHPVELLPEPPQRRPLDGIGVAPVAVRLAVTTERTRGAGAVRPWRRAISCRLTNTVTMSGKRQECRDGSLDHQPAGRIVWPVARRPGPMAFRDQVADPEPG
jgi:hypothetical protein